MGYVIRRRLGSGRVRYTAVYGDIRGRRRSAGTFATAKLAAKAWQKAEADLASGRIGDPRRGQQTLRRYVEQEWFPNHLIEATTREGYTYLLNRYILPELGEIRMVEILPGQVREWITRLQDVYGARPPTIRKCKVVLDAILTTALNDQITVLHAGRGVKTPPVATRPRRIITVEQFDRILAALDDDTMRLLVETDIESGLRWGELTELRVRDIDFETGTLTVSRVVVHLRAKSLGGGPRFVVKDYPKDKEWRQLRLAPHILAQLTAHVANRGLGRDDLLFAMPKSLVARRRTVPDRLPDPNTLGLTEPNAVGRRYRHGTTTAYTNGRCRCQHCRDAISAYRAARRAAGRDQPRAARIVETDGHIGNDWFRANVWRKAMDAADLGFRVTPHSLRHAHASWLLAGGADIQVVKERLGHGSIVTTERYLRALPTARDAGLAALDSVRRPGSATTSVASTDASARDAELSELAELVIKLESLQRSLASRSS